MLRRNQWYDRYSFKVSYLCIHTFNLMETINRLPTTNGGWITHVKTKFKIKHRSWDTSFVERIPVIMDDIKNRSSEGVINISQCEGLVEVQVGLYFFPKDKIRARTRHKMRGTRHTLIEWLENVQIFVNIII